MLMLISAAILLALYLTLVSRQKMSYSKLFGSSWGRCTNEADVNGLGLGF